MVQSSTLWSSAALPPNPTTILPILPISPTRPCPSTLPTLIMPQTASNTSRNIHSAMFGLNGPHAREPKITGLSSSAPKDRTLFTLSQYDVDDESDDSDKDSAISNTSNYPNSSRSSISLPSTSPTTHQYQHQDQHHLRKRPQNQPQSESSQRNRHSVGYEPACSLPTVPESSPLIMRGDSHESTGSHSSSSGKLRRNFAFTTMQDIRL